MALRGRPPATRARVLGYIQAHGPCNIAEIVRGTGASRRHIHRLLRAQEKAAPPIFVTYEKSFRKGNWNAGVREGHGMGLGLYTSERSGRRRQGDIIATGANISDKTILDQDHNYITECAIASDRLLHRMIETGQHWLTPDQANAICIAKGWDHLIGPMRVAA